MAQMTEVAVDKEIKSAQAFLQCLHQDRGFRESLRMTSPRSLTEFIQSNGFCFDQYELVTAFIEHMESLSEGCDDCDCSLYERGLFELL